MATPPGTPPPIERPKISNRNKQRNLESKLGAMAQSRLGLPRSPGGININQVLWKLSPHGNIPVPRNIPPTSPFPWGKNVQPWLKQKLLKNMEPQKPKKNGSININDNGVQPKELKFGPTSNNSRNSRKSRKSKSRKSKRRGTRKN